MNQFEMYNNPWFLLVLIWALFWKGCALYFAAKDEKKVWFWIMLIVNLFGLLEIFYIFQVSKRKWSDVQALFTKDNTPKDTLEIIEVETETIEIVSEEAKTE